MPNLSAYHEAQRVLAAVRLPSPVGGCPDSVAVASLPVRVGLSDDEFDAVMAEYRPLGNFTEELVDNPDHSDRSAHA